MSEASSAPPEDGTLAVLHAMLTTFTDVLDGMDRRLGAMEDTLRSLRADQDQAAELRHALQQLGRVEAIETDLSEIRSSLLNHPAATLHDAVEHLTRQVDSLVAQPGPGPAMAMVAAGLSERFEQRTQGLVEMVQEHAELMHALTEQVQAAMQGLVSAVEGRQAGLDTLLDTVRAAAGTIEGMRVRLEDQSLAGLTEVVHDESELLAQRISAVSVALDSVRKMLADHVEESAHSLGRKASEAGRRLVSDLTLAARSRDRGARPVLPPAKKLPPEREP